MKKQQSSASVVVLPSQGLPDEDLSQATSDQSLSITRMQLPAGIDDTTLVPFYVLRNEGKPKLIVEIVRFTSTYGSWFFVPESELDVPHVCSNGNITIVTAVDPLFSALLFMDVGRIVGGKELFQPLDSMCCTEDGVDLSKFCNADQFTLLCDVKQAADQHFYKLNDDKVLSWLIAKHAALSKHPMVKTKDAVDIISQYLSPKWIKTLRKSLLLDVDEVDTASHKASKEAQSLAMAIMMEDAKESNEARRIEQEERFGTSSQGKKKPAKPTKKKVERAPEAKFWACREQSLKAKDKKSGVKRTRSSSSTK